MHDITKLLEKIQSEKKLSNYGLAQLLGISPQHLYKIRKQSMKIDEAVATKIGIHAQIDPMEVIASVNYFNCPDHLKDFWKTVFFTYKIKNYRIEYSSGGFYRKPWYIRNRKY